MIELKTNTAVRVPVGPLVDPTDGKTAETALDVTTLSVQIYQTKTDGSAVVRTQITPTASGGSNDMALVASSTDGMYDLELTAAQLNWLGCGRLSVYDVDGFLVWWMDFAVVSANYFDWKYGSGNVNADIIAVSGDSDAADNLELDYDGTGYDKANSTIGTCTTNTDMRGTDNAALAATALSNAVWTDAKAGYLTGNVALEATAQSILTDTGTTLEGHLTDIKGATFNGATDSLEAIRDRGDAAWVTATSVTVSDKSGFSLAADQSTVTIGTVNSANVKKINDVTLTGDGDATPWGPA